MTSFLVPVKCPKSQLGDLLEYLDRHAIPHEVPHVMGPPPSEVPEARMNGNAAPVLRNDNHPQPERATTRVATVVYRALDRLGPGDTIDAKKLEALAERAELTRNSVYSVLREAIDQGILVRVERGTYARRPVS